MSYFFESLR